MQIQLVIEPLRTLVLHLLHTLTLELPLLHSPLHLHAPITKIPAPLLMLLHLIQLWIGLISLIFLDLLLQLFQTICNPQEVLFIKEILKKFLLMHSMDFLEIYLCLRKFLMLTKEDIHREMKRKYTSMIEIVKDKKHFRQDRILKDQPFNEKNLEQIQKLRVQ